MCSSDLKQQTDNDNLQSQVTTNLNSLNAQILKEESDRVSLQNAINLHTQDIQAMKTFDASNLTEFTNIETQFTTLEAQINTDKTNLQTQITNNKNSIDLHTSQIAVHTSDIQPMKNFDVSALSEFTDLQNQITSNLNKEITDRKSVV